ncbi:MAG: rod shape-determining protein MreC [Acidobacteriota bacterium]
MLDIRRRTGVLLFVVTMFQVILISVQVQSKSGVPVLQDVAFGVFSRFQGGSAGVIQGARGFWENYFALRGVRAENEALHHEVSELGVRLQEQRALAARSIGLQALLDLQEGAALPTMAAEVIAGNSNPGMRTITIGRGSADGVRADMAVIAPAGIVGRILGAPAAHAARVQLLIDHNAAAGAVVDRTRAGGMVTGIENDPSVLAMEFVSNMADVKVGDAVVASGADGIYPKGFMIGQIQTADRGPQLYRVMTVRPAVDFASLEDVLVVLVPARSAIPDQAVPAAPAGPAK